MIIPSFASKGSLYVIEQLEQYGYEAFFVGGAVRDHLLGKKATDLDIATSAELVAVQAIFPRTIDIGIEHGTILVVIDDEPIEVTTFRTGALSPSVKTLKEDLLRRDFTMNALAMTKEGQLIDFYNGRADITNKCIRAVGLPHERFEEDPLRLLRAVRFAAVLNFTIEEETFAAIKKYATHLESVAIERVKIEFDKLFLGGNVSSSFDLLIDSNLHKALPLFPTAVKQVKELVPFQSSEEGWAHFMLLSKCTASEVGRAYKLSNDEKRLLTHVEKAYQARLNGVFTIDDIYHYDALILFIVEKFYTVANGQQVEQSVQTFEVEKAKLPIQSMQDLCVSGRDLLKWAPIRGGRWVGEWMAKIEYAVLHEQCENEIEHIKEWFMNDFNSEG